MKATQPLSNNGSTGSRWLNTVSPQQYSRLSGRLEVDVLVVGAGITGITSAYLLTQSNCRVAVIDKQGIGGGDTGHTTAHITYVTDKRLSELVSSFGESQAKLFWDAGQLAMFEIEAIVEKLRIECGLQRVPGYLMSASKTPQESEIKDLQEEARFAELLGFEATFLDADPIFNRCAVRFSNQLKFHPLQYIQALAEAVSQHKLGAIYTNVGVSSLDDERHEWHFQDGVIKYGTLLAATHAPIQGERGTLGAAMFQTKLAAYSTYAIEAQIEEQPASLFWDTQNPYYYYRFEQNGGESSVIIGGEDHRTGREENTRNRFAHLEAQLHEDFPDARVKRRWSGQIHETPDGLPYIGQVAPRQYLATGFAGNGMTLGTYAAMVLNGLISQDEAHPGSELYLPNRNVLKGALDYVSENKNLPVELIKGFAQRGDNEMPKECLTGAIVRVDGRKLAAYRDVDGELMLLSPICPHMGCVVSWNQAEKTWDCPCHGSRFSACGDLIGGPAEKNLEPR